MHLLKAQYAHSTQLYPPSESTTQKISSQSSHSTTPRSLINPSCPQTKNPHSSGERIIITTSTINKWYLWKSSAGQVKQLMWRSKLWVVKYCWRDGRGLGLALLGRGVECCGRVCCSGGLFATLTVLARIVMIPALGKWAVKNVKKRRTNCKVK